jgi:hypothetical protein
MTDVLTSLELLLLNQACGDWPLALAVLLVVLMTVESIHYHAAKVAYHHAFDSPQAKDADDHTLDDQDIQAMFNFYSACFPGCHARLRPEWEGEGTTAPVLGMGMSLPNASSKSPEDRFIDNVREAMKRASPEAYLAQKASAKRVGDDMAFFFDRLVARLLVLQL